MYLYSVSFVLILQFFQIYCLTIQAMIDLDNDSENLIAVLVDKVDSIIDPKITDTENATHELAYALLRVGPLITVNGTISEAIKGIRLSFNCQVKADTTMAVTETISSNSNAVENNSEWKSDAGILKQLVSSLDSFLHYIIMLIFNGIITNIVTNIMTEAALLSNVNLT